MDKSINIHEQLIAFVRIIVSHFLGCHSNNFVNLTYPKGLQLNVGWSMTVIIHQELKNSNVFIGP